MLNPALSNKFMTSALEDDFRSTEYSSFLSPIVRRRMTSSLPVGNRESLGEKEKRRRWKARKDELEGRGREGKEGSERELKGRGRREES